MQRASIGGIESHQNKGRIPIEGKASNHDKFAISKYLSW